jgi:hypothetical protein
MDWHSDRHEFEQRGMPWGRYLAQTRVIGAVIGVHYLDRNFWEGVGRSHPVGKKASRKI